MLPIGFIEEVQLSIDKKIARHASDTHAGYYKDIDSFGNSELITDSTDLTYKIKGDYIYMSKQTGNLFMVYKSIKIQDDITSDDYGQPMLPDDPIFILALQSYIENQFIRMLFRAGKVTNQVLEESKQTYA